MTAITTTKLPDGSEMPVFGLGTWKMGENKSLVDAEVAAVRTGLDLGVTLIDTAEMYGNGSAELVVGEAISGRRDATYLVSKVLPSNAAYSKVIRACENSLQRLGTDRLELYLLHWRGQTRLEETVHAFEELKQAGKILNWGVSNFEVDDMRELEAISSECATNQVLYNLTRRGIEHDLLDYAASRSMPIMAYSPIEQGRLAKAAVLAEIAKAHDATPAQIALAWVLNRKGIVAIPKTSRPERIAENLKSLEIKLTQDDLITLDKAFPRPASKIPLEMI
jgi:diketogulonate reductase-like aldo/keto reductase